MTKHFTLSIVVVAAWATLEWRVTARVADPDPRPVDRVFFQYDYFKQVRASPDHARLQSPFLNQNSTGIVASNNIVCFIDPVTGETRSPFTLYTPPLRVPMNVVAGNWTNRLVAITAPAEASNNSPRVVAMGPPHQLIGDLPRASGADQSGTSIAVGNFTGDAQLDIAYTTGAGPATRITFGTLGQNRWYTFLPAGDSYNGGARLTAGPLRRNGFDQLIVAMDGGRVDIFGLSDDEIERMGSDFPVGPTPNVTPFVDAFDTNNDGRWELLVADTSHVTAIDLNNGATPLTLWQHQPFNAAVPGGIQFSAGLAGGKLILGAVNRQLLSIWSMDPATQAWMQTFSGAPFGNAALPMSFWLYDPYYDVVPR